ncbi:MAG: hypothetical protein IT381_00025 [Deltaproteobacteria bacterium]|nr:hypothetical protein [Deltaproteobacteria bacterium]
MTAVSSQIDDELLSLAWSLWAELGVSSVVRAHGNCCADPEALLIFTAALADADPRLRDESLDCALALSPYLWTSRLKTLLSRTDDEVRHTFGEYAATFNQSSTSHVTLPLADETRALSLIRSGKSRPQAQAHAPSQLLMRCRAIFGVGARADALCTMIFSRQQGWLATDLATHVGLPKRAMAAVLHDFAVGGLVIATSVGNRLRYDFVGRDGLDLVLGAKPNWKPVWAVILPFLLRMRAIVVARDARGPTSSLVDAHKVIRSFLAASSTLGIHADAPDTRSWEDVIQWLVRTVSAIANGESVWFGESRGLARDSMTKPGTARTGLVAP